MKLRLKNPAKPHVTLPSLRGIRIAPAINGAIVSHLFRGSKPKQFIFHDPAKMVAHLNRTLHNAWLHPNDQAEAARINRDINVGAEPWQT